MATDRYKDVSWVRLGDLSAEHGTKSARDFYEAIMYGVAGSGCEYAADARVHVLKLKVQNAARRAQMTAFSTVLDVFRDPWQTATGGFASLSTFELCDVVKEASGVLANLAEDHYDADVGKALVAAHTNIRKALSAFGPRRLSPKEA